MPKIFEAEAEQIAAGRLYGGWQHAEKQHTHIKRRRQDAFGNETDRHAEKREKAEGDEQDRQMQAPVQDARNHHIPRKPRTMQKEEKRDRQFRRKAEILRRLAANRQDGGQNHGGHQHHGETIGQEAGHGSLSGIGFA
jgi:hypothetical protein